MLDILLALEAKLQALADKAGNLEQHVVDDVKEAVAHVAHLKTFFGTVQTAEQVTVVDTPAPAVGPATTEVEPVAVAAPAADTQVATDAPAAVQPAAQ